MGGPLRKPHERAVIFCCAMGEMTLEATNELLGAADIRVVPPSSWKMLMDAYVPAFRKDPQALQENIFHPKALGDL